MKRQKLLYLSYSDLQHASLLSRIVSHRNPLNVLQTSIWPWICCISHPLRCATRSCIFVFTPLFYPLCCILHFLRYAANSCLLHIALPGNRDLALLSRTLQRLRCATGSYLSNLHNYQIHLASITSTKVGGTEGGCFWSRAVFGCMIAINSYTSGL